MTKRSKGRPPTKPIQLMDGFYIEVRNMGSRERGVKIRCATKEIMDQTVAQYKRNGKEVTVLGEHKDFQWESERTPKPAKKAKGKVAA